MEEACLMVIDATASFPRRTPGPASAGPGAEGGLFFYLS